MNESKITSGPWSWEFSRIGGRRTALSNHVGQDVMIATSDIDGHTFIDISEDDSRLVAAASDLFEALQATEGAEDHWANCEECENSGAESPELGCEACFNLADKARLMRRAALDKAKGGPDVNSLDSRG